MKIHPLFGLALWLGLCLAMMVTGALFTTPAIPGWYSGLKKPVWTPPSWVFGPVWFILYFLMALAAWLVWKQENLPLFHWPLVVFVIQLGLNLGWSYIFFGLQKPGMAFGEIVFLWSAILITLASFWPINRFAGFLLLPYFIWVTFAAFLNFSIWRLNRF
ncbi:MAG: tryptophan-rich sensory protein [Desulfobacteraceae bacterium]|nr:MAG: tryptophan-rich sensory protein [Desulfobacteraceae bacterium]